MTAQQAAASDEARDATKLQEQPTCASRMSVRALGRPSGMASSVIASPPKARWPFAEVAWLVSGAAGVVLFWGEFEVGVVVGFVSCALGVVFGSRGLRRKLLARAFDREWARAKAEWTTLSRG